ncbi:MAG TPA: MBOAT family O-acyltransferase [Myxococcota bacterium]|nr:MBOAT family O-acyltransferase [Myxococcota bacterium]
MTFVQPEFVGLFLGVWLVYWRLGRVAQNVLLVLAGLVFYGWVHPWFLIPLVVSSAVDFFAGLGMEAWPERRRALLGVSLAANLGMLGWFKYAGWFVENVDAALRGIGLGGVGTLSVMIPVGISFYTFQTLSYTLDVYRGKLPARRSPLDFFVFVSFFPQLVAGPIERATHLLPQVERQREFTWADQRDGLSLALWGAFKKMAIADNLAPWVDRVHAHPDPSFGMIWSAGLAFSVQLLCDFSGYTDIARGTGRMLGFSLSENFRWPYLATTPMQAWSRFHMTLTSWLTDYVYYPLAQARWVRWLKLPGTTVGGAGHVARVTLLTFLVSGLWHGASWGFVLWGLFLGSLQIVYVAAQRRIPRRVRDDARWVVFTVPLMFAFQLVAQLLFRTPTLGQIVHHLTRAPWDQTPAQGVVAAGTVGVTILFATPLWLAMAYERWVMPRLVGRPWYPVVQGLGWGTWISAIAWMSRPTANDFIYFQF